MTPLREQILRTVEELPLEARQQVLDFVEFLRSKRQLHEPSEMEQPQRSFLETAQFAIGAGEGPEDLSTHQDYMDRYGQ